MGYEWGILMVYNEATMTNVFLLPSRDHGGWG